APIKAPSGAHTRSDGAPIWRACVLRGGLFANGEGYSPCGQKKSAQRRNMAVVAANPLATPRNEDGSRTVGWSERADASRSKPRERPGLVERVRKSERKMIYFSVYKKESENYLCL
ncbi:MAG: hypothetical protein DRI01_10000, partial [Chloroflexi bacterium]